MLIKYNPMKHPLRSLLHLFVAKKKSPQLEPGSELPDEICRQFSLAELKAATNNFHPDSIFRTIHGCSTLYKGIIDYGTVVFIKRIYSSSKPNEVEMLCQLHHPHLVSLIGFCLLEKQTLLVFEYMSRGSLADFLFGGGEDFVPLAWKRRLQICIGAARGLHYLHTGAKRSVIHRDIRTSNILIDEQWSSKLSDFDLSKLGPRSMSKALIRIDSRVLGTLGFMDPEYAMSGELTEKSDVFSFGVTLFVVLFGKAAIDRSLPTNQSYILDWAKESLREGTIYHAIDPQLKGRVAPECLNKYLEIASSCVHGRANERPAMGEVEVTLELALELQNRADAEMEAFNPSGEYLYEEALFSAFLRNFSGLDSKYTSLLSYSDSSSSNSSS
ncbi:Malectin/receptor protein kinase family protein [Hibiscus syriacus]|uniref:Malectin/receptor protein kinase family protein n=1 Tax=Hibiscus syriacus TaxID=106335 RepID=A0A6A3C3Y6_HIBSY|nr:receptor-like protein kinase ANXUR2 [Hibiscus syriacus]KAE8722308.1 Malectin/receptor protein kinase family protein [Hibiscus syriacus]